MSLKESGSFLGVSFVKVGWNKWCVVSGKIEMVNKFFFFDLR